MNPSKIQERLLLAFMRELVNTPEGRKHVLSQVADAEHSGEARVFDAMLAWVDREKADAQLARTIEKHRDDEIRHEALFRACIARQGGAPMNTPPELRIMDRLDPAVGGFLERTVEDGRGIMEAYLILQVLEERAVSQFPLFVTAFAAVDPATAKVFEEVAKDEERHLLYCHAIARRYAPDEATLVSTLARFRVKEAEVFRDNQKANFGYVLANGYIAGRFTRVMWRAIDGVAGAVAGLPFTKFANESSQPKRARASRLALG